MLALALTLAAQPPADWIDPFLAGSRSLERGELEAALESLARVQAILPEHAASAYLLACAHARSGDLDAALEWLGSAGELDAAQLAWDPWLDDLREDPRFAALVVAARDGQAEAEPFPFELVRDRRRVSGYAVSDDGVVVVALDHGWLLDPRSGALAAPLVPRSERLLGALVDPEGHWILVLSWSEDRRSASLRVHDPTSGDVMVHLPDSARSELMTLDRATGHLVLRGRHTGTVRRFSTTTWKRDRSRISEEVEGGAPAPSDPPDQVLLRAARLATSVAVARSTPTAWLGVGDGSLRELDIDSGRTLRALPGADGAIVSADLSQDDGLLAWVDDYGDVRSLDSGSLNGGSFQHVAGAATSWRGPRLDLAPDGARALLALPDGGVALVDLDAGQVLQSFSRARNLQPVACWSPAGARFAIGAHEPGVARVFAARDGAPAGPELRVDGQIQALAFEPTRDRLWVGTGSSVAFAFDIASGRRMRWHSIHDLDPLDVCGVGSLSFTPDGRMATIGSSGFGGIAAVRTEDGERLWNFGWGHGSNPSAFRTSFDATGERVFVYGQGSWSARVVDARTGETQLDLADRGFMQLWPVAGGERVLARGPRGLECLDARDGRVLWARSELADNGWLLRSPSGHVDGTRDALERLHLALAERSLPLDALAAALLDPAKVRAAAEGVALAPETLPATPTLHWRERQPRVLRLTDEHPTAKLVLESSAPGGVIGFEQRLDGELDFVAAERGTLELELELTRPPPGAAREYRWRAIGAGGLASRALYLRVERR